MTKPTKARCIATHARSKPDPVATLAKAHDNDARFASAVRALVNVHRVCTDEDGCSLLSHIQEEHALIYGKEVSP